MMEQTPTDSVVVETIVATANASGVGGAYASTASGARSSFFEKLAFWLFSATAVLVPFFVFPVTGLPLDGGKKFFVAFGVLAALLSWFISRIMKGSIVIPRGAVTWSSVAVLGVMLLAALNSGNQGASFWGTGVETQTYSALILFAGAGYLASMMFQSHERLHKFFNVFWLVYLSLFVLQCVRFFWPGVFAFAALRDPSMTLLGKWYDFGIFSGLALTLAVVALESGYRGVRRGILWGVFATSLVASMVVNFYPVWTALVLVGLGALAYRFATGSRFNSSRVSWTGILLVAAALLFMFTGAPDQFAGKIVAKLGVPTVLEVRPSWGVTFDVAKATLAQHAFLGGGLNRFVNEWYLYRPTSVNQTYFWSTDFLSGIGIIPTVLVTAGLLGFLSWVVLLGIFAWVGFKTIARNTDHPLCSALVFSYVGALFLWIFSVVYIPDTTVLFATAVFTGIFVAARAALEDEGNFRWSFSRNRRVGFVLLLAVLLLAVASALGLFMTGKKLIAIRSFQKGVQEATIVGNIDGAYTLLTKATELDRQDLYFRTLSELDIVRLNRLMNSKEADAEKLRADFQTISGQAITHASEAVKIDPTRHANWIGLGTVYAALVPAKVQGAYEMAQQMYTKAQEVYPQSPSVQLQLARLETAKGDKKKAREYIAEALKRKNNYTEAIFFLSQLEADSGNIAAAIKAAEQAATLSPNDVGVAFQLGLLMYTEKDFTGAVGAFERAVSIVPTYSNARYFLGLSYARLGRSADALAQFQEIAKYNPENTEVKQIIQNLGGNKEAIDSSVTPPEKRDTLPLPEN